MAAGVRAAFARPADQRDDYRPARRLGGRGLVSRAGARRPTLRHPLEWPWLARRLAPARQRVRYASGEGIFTAQRLGVRQLPAQRSLSAGRLPLGWFGLALGAGARFRWHR